MTAPPTGRMKRYASVISRWLVVVVVVFSITLWAGKYITENWLTKSYEATASVAVKAPASADSIAKLATTRKFLLSVVQSLHPTGEASASDEDSLELLRQQVKVSVDSENLAIVVSNSDPLAAASIANAVADRLQADGQTKGTVEVSTRASLPTEPTSPNKLICFGLTVGAAGLLSLLIGCFVEVIMLFVRASEGEHS